MSTTRVNPGAFQKRKNVTLYKLGSNLKQRLRDFGFQSALNYLIAEGVNLFNERVGYRLLRQRFYCPNCQNKSTHFVHISNAFKISWNSACPSCNSRSRHRGLKFLYDELLQNQKIRLLHFAPEPILTETILKNTKVEYITTDFLLHDVDLPGEDIQNLSLQDNSFDMVFCNHVIEHVPDDLKALKELSRILKKHGKVVITIPGKWTRMETIYFKDLRHNGHYRDYGMEVINLLKSVFSEVVMVNLSDYQKKDTNHLSYGLPIVEPVFICKK